MTLGPVLFYGRKSDERRRSSGAGVRIDETISVANQELAGRARAERDWPGAPFEAFRDERYSGGLKPHERPDMARLLERLGELQRLHVVPSALIMTSQARAARGGVADVDVVLDAALLAGLDVITLIDGRDIDLDPLERFDPHLQALIDARYRNEARKSAKRSHSLAAEEGRPRAGHVPFGYRAERGDDGRPVWVIDEDEGEADAVRRVWQLAEEGLSARRIAGVLNDEGVAWRDGKPWTMSTANKVLRRPLYAGLREHRQKGTSNVKLHAARWAGIIDLERWQRMNDDVRPLRALGQKRPTHWLVGLQGVLECAVCHEPLHADTSTRVGLRAKCRDGHSNVDLELASDLLAELIVQRFTTAGDEALELLAGRTTDTAGLRAERARIELRLKELGQLFAAGTVDATALSAASADLAAQRDVVDRQLTQAVKLPADLSVDDLGDVERFLALAEPVKRQVASLLLEAVVVTPAGRGFLSGARSLGPVGSDAYVAEVARLTLSRLERRWR